MHRIPEILSRFEPISLDQAGSVKLMDRKDTKFVFRDELLPGILGKLQEDYLVLEAGPTRSPRYETDYFDTADFHHFRQHHSKHLNRFKVRLRKYLDTGDAFFEIKKRNNHGNTVKKRIPVSQDETVINDRLREFLETNHCCRKQDTEPKLRIRFHRITLVGREQPERITLDFGLHYSNGKTEHACERLIIGEVKQERLSRSSFERIMRAEGIRPYSISKYCLGIATLYGHIRHNLVKPKIRYINKLTHDPHRHS